jgi:hypothetical protein
MASNCNPPDFCLLRIQDYRRDPLVPGMIAFSISAQNVIEFL